MQKENTKKVSPVDKWIEATIGQCQVSNSEPTSTQKRKLEKEQKNSSQKSQRAKTCRLYDPIQRPRDFVLPEYMLRQMDPAKLEASRKEREERETETALVMTRPGQTVKGLYFVIYVTFLAPFGVPFTNKGAFTKIKGLY